MSCHRVGMMMMLLCWPYSPRRNNVIGNYLQSMSSPAAPHWLLVPTLQPVCLPVQHEIDAKCVRELATRPRNVELLMLLVYKINNRKFRMS